MPKSYSSRSKAAAKRSPAEQSKPVAGPSELKLVDGKELPIQPMTDDRRCLGYRGNVIVGNSQLSSSGLARFFPDYVSNFWSVTYSEVCVCEEARPAGNFLPDFYKNRNMVVKKKKKMPCSIVPFNFCRTQFEVLLCSEMKIYSIYLPVDCEVFLDRLKEYIARINKSSGNKAAPYILPSNELRMVIEMVKIDSEEDFQNMLRILHEEFDKFKSKFAYKAVVFGAVVSGDASMARSAQLPVLHKVLLPIVLNIRRRLTRAGYSLVNNHIVRDLSIDIATVQQNNAVTEEPMEAFNASDLIASSYDDNDEDDENFEEDIPFARNYKDAISDIIFSDIYVVRGLHNPELVTSLKEYKSW